MIGAGTRIDDGPCCRDRRRARTCWCRFRYRAGFRRDESAPACAAQSTGNWISSRRCADEHCLQTTRHAARASSCQERELVLKWLG